MGSSTKLFVGMLSRDCTDDEVRTMFTVFGNVTDCAVLKDPKGNSKGCAFVTFERTDDANAAISALHGSTKMDGCKGSIVVKFADNEQQKQQRYQSQIVQEGSNGALETSDTKLFVGMMGDTANEDDLEKMFSSYGKILECAVLRDGDGKSKGCGFIRLSKQSECLDAIRGLHNSTTLPGANSSIVVKFADTDKQRQQRQHRNDGPGSMRDNIDLDDTKIFVGMLGSMDDVNELREMFNPFGKVVDCAILKDSSSGRTKGCGFVRFSLPKEAYTAIRVMNGSEKLPGASANLVVKFADNKRPKEDKQSMGAYGNHGGFRGSGFGNYGNFSNPNMNPMGMNQGPTNSFMSNTKSPAMNQLLQQQLALTAAAMNLANGGGGQGPTGNQFGSGSQMWPGNQYDSQGSPYNTASSGNQYGSMNNQFGGNRPSLPPPPPPSYQGTSQFSNNQFSNNDQNDFNNFNDDPMANQDNGGSNLVQQALSQGQQALSNPSVLQQAIAQQQAFIQQALVAQQFNQTPTNQTSSQQEPSRPGPDGCNLFVMHLPKECNDFQLRQLFSPFGNVLSSNIFYDKVTSESKCFGFISFDEQAGAQNAIKSMNGFQIGGKRLKVQLKTNKKPY